MNIGLALHCGESLSPPDLEVRKRYLDEID
jgi:hypothetical protein